MQRVALRSSWLLLVLVGCARSPAPAETIADPDPAPEVAECVEPPERLGRDLDRQLSITHCVISLEPPTLDVAARAHAIETVHALGIHEPFSLELANQVASSDLAAANWEGLDDPVVHERLRSSIALLEPFVESKVYANHSIHAMSLSALMCAHAVLGEAQRAQAYGQELLMDRPGTWLPTIYLTIAELGDEQTAIPLLERVAEFDEYYKPYVNYRIAWALLHPTIVDEARAVQLLEELLANTETWPRLARLLRHRAALELRALGREVEVPELRCTNRKA